MLLSNARKNLLAGIVFTAFLLGCGSSPRNENRPIALTVETKSEFPFATTEPEIYQADFVTKSGDVERRTFMARKREKWRIDFYRTGSLSTSEVNADKLFVVDHARKLYAVKGENDSAEFDPNFLSGMTPDFFRGKEYREFEALGLEGNLRKYKVRTEKGLNDEVVIFVDEATGMIVRQEFTQAGDENRAPISFVYEIQNLKLDVDDSLFALPDGYRQVSFDEFRSGTKQNK